MLEVSFLPADDDARSVFLAHGVLEALGPLPETQAPRWGKMNPQQMVEHLAWTFELSTGAAEVECLVPPERILEIKPFIFNDQPNPRNFQHPALKAGLPPLRHAGLAASVASLRTAMARFEEQFRRDPAALHLHPLLGPIDGEAWARIHYKHCYHHLAQFGLVGEPAPRES